MTRRDYVKIAGVLNDALKSTAAPGTVLSIADRLADVLKADNAAFDRDRFLAAVKK